MPGSMSDSMPDPMPDSSPQSAANAPASPGQLKPQPNARFYDTIARFYDAENLEMTEDLPLFSELAADLGDPILDIGCGTGRVMLHLAREGYRVTGIDHAAEMLARGERKLDRQPDLKPLVRFVQGDVLDPALGATLGERFKLVLVPYNGFMHFHTQADQLAALKQCAAWLAEDGQIVLDLPNAGDAYATEDDPGIVLERMFTEPESGHLVMQQSSSEIDRAAQMLHITWIYDELASDGAVRRTVAPLHLRYVFPAELDLLLAAAGLQAVEVVGDYDLMPFGNGSPRLIVIAEHA